MPKPMANTTTPAAQNTSPTATATAAAAAAAAGAGAASSADAATASSSAAEPNGASSNSGGSSPLKTGDRSGSKSPTPQAFASASDNVLPIAILMDELKHVDGAVRVRAVRKIRTIALALGPERTRDELVSFVEAELLYDDDEVLFHLAEELALLPELIGGAEYVRILLPSLESLVTVEENVVRLKAIESIGALCTLLSSSQIEQLLVPIFTRLASGDWFTCRTSACGILPHFYSKLLPATKVNLRKTFASLAQDERPMVRRAAASSLAQLVPQCEAEVLKADIFSIFFKLATDEQDSVRILTVPVFLALAERVEFEDTKNSLLPTLLNLIHDKSWRVRYMAAKNFVAVAKVIPPTEIDMSESYAQLLRDPEAEVRTAAALQLGGISRLLQLAPVISTILPILREVTTDKNQHVRAALATQTASLAAVVGPERAVEELLPLFMLELRDEFSEVRLNLISSLDVLCGVLSLEHILQGLLPSIVELAEDKQWRVRLAIVERVPLLSKLFTETQFYDKLGSICFNFLRDPVFTVREAACKNLHDVAAIYGSKWTCKFLLPELEPMLVSQNYLHRMVAVNALSTLTPTISVSEVADHILPLFVRLCADPVPNVRFNVAKSMEAIMPLLRANKADEPARIALGKLVSDPDVDVRYFASRAIKA